MGKEPFMPIRISENDYLHLSESEKHVIDYINEHEKQLSELSITTIAQKSFTSLATVSRAIRKCGYGGIAELRYSLNKKSEERDDTYVINNILNQSYRECIKTIDNVSIPSILTVTGYIRNAKRILIYSRGLTALVAEEFAHYLLLSGYNAFVMKDAVIMRRTDKLLTKDDVMIIVTVENTTPELAESAAMAKKLGAKVISLVCKAGTNLEKYSDVTIVGHAESVVDNDVARSASRIPLSIICHIITEYLAK